MKLTNTCSVRQSLRLLRQVDLDASLPVAVIVLTVCVTLAAVLDLNLVVIVVDAAPGCLGLVGVPPLVCIAEELPHGHLELIYNAIVALDRLLTKVIGVSWQHLTS